MANTRGRLLKKDAEICVQAIRNWCERFYEKMFSTVITQDQNSDEDESALPTFIPGNYGKMTEFLESCRHMDIIITARQARGMAYTMQNEGLLETFETRR